MRGAAGGPRAGKADGGWTFYKENHIMACTNTSDEAEICQEIMYTVYHSQEISAKFNLVIPVLLAGVG